MAHPHSDIEVLFSAEAIQQRVRSLASEIARTCPKDVMIVGLLRGSFVFLADLIRALHSEGVQPQIDFMTISSYGNSTVSQGVTIYRDMNEDVSGRCVLLVDDILESGRTLHHARNIIEERGAASLFTAVLLEKPGKRLEQYEADFVGFIIPDKFVIGYGLDYANYYRELPFIGVVKSGFPA